MIRAHYTLVGQPSDKDFDHLRGALEWWADQIPLWDTSIIRAERQSIPPVVELPGDKWRFPQHASTLAVYVVPERIWLNDKKKIGVVFARNRFVIRSGASLAWYVHEAGHVLGLDHVPDKLNVMHPDSLRSRKVTFDQLYATSEQLAAAQAKLEQSHYIENIMVAR